MALKATISGGTLRVVGSAASSAPPTWNGLGRVEVDMRSDGVTVQDNGSVGADVPIRDDGTLVRAIDLSGLRNGAAFVSAPPTIESVIGSAQSDRIYVPSVATGATKVLADGGAGDDSIDLGAGNDTLIGRDGNDSLYGNRGDDRLNGGIGDDTIDGGSGYDTAFYAGNRSHYSVRVDGGEYVVTDLRARGSEGTDRLANVERLQFRDGVMDLPVLSALDPQLAGGTLSVTGTFGGPYGSVRVELLTFGTWVWDYNGVGVDVPISSDDSTIRTVDMRGLTGVGATVDVDVPGVNAIFGSERGDSISVSESGRATLDGGGGSDWISSGDGNDALLGRAGDDWLWGRGGNDRLTGHAGNDTIDGGEGIDTAVFSGRRSDYSVSSYDGGWIVWDVRQGAPDGRDILSSVERLQFRDVLVTLPVNPSPPTNVEATVTDGRLTVSGSSESPEIWGANVNIDGPSITVRDGTTASFEMVDVPVDSDGSLVRVIDLRELDGISGFVSAEGSHIATVIGSAGQDQISIENAAGGPARVVLDGGAGGDSLHIYGSAGTLMGRAGNDYLYGDRGDDRLNGSLGDDQIDGGAGVDVAIYAGNRSDFSIAFQANQVVVTDLRARGAEGRDTLLHVEQLQFRDGVVDLVALQADRAALTAAPLNPWVDDLL